ncbi:OstA-like protein [Sphingobacterium sp. SGG-5]|uniref:OstA-like protein n=1 Tax=Sphingobacterium sp. SGG-5 TaxID=2710881 RepID=UPI001F0D30D5|nr:OstA-like protein [Sphingobacterium sp. SGG-5]
MVFFNPVYEHKGNTLSADSGYIYEDEIKQQFFEAFGHVVITQPSGTVINSDYLHYDATAQHARLTGNVKMVDATSVLTTNFLTYNMRSKVGTYQNGGRIISRGDTITSKNAYYFENTSDAYFRYKVIVRTPNVKVYTDTMRYNSITKDTYFFGPTNIKGNKNENLYTERGVYNTGTGIAKFNKNNLYTEDTKFLKGDSLYYNRDNGIGEAYRNVVFVDTLDKFYAYGGKGVYRQDEESILMTEKPLIITVVKNDTTANQETADSTAVQVDSTIRQMDSTPVQTDSTLIEVDSTAAAKQLRVMEKDSVPPAAVDSVYMTADTLYSRVIPIRDYHPLDLKLDRDGGQLIDEEEVDYGDVSETGEVGAQDSTLSPLDSNSTVLPDSTALQLDAATLTDSTTVVPPDPPQIKAKRPPLRAEPGNATIEMTQKADSTLRQEAVIPTGNEANDLITEALRVAQTPDTVAPDTVQQADSPPVPTLDSLGNPLDSLSSPLDSLRALPDSAKTRIVRAYYNVRLFKSDLQAVADSAYYGMVDSMFRFMGRPMIWAQGSQISADTIYMQIINQQVDNALLKNNAFMVNAVLDTVKFNQLKGRKITAFFANNNIDRLFVDGNAENLSFSADEEKQIITEMFHDRGARIKVRMENKEIIDYITIRKVDQKVYPFSMVTQENEILQGFIWRPQDRPTSKEDLLNRKREVPKETVPAAPADATASGEQTPEEPSSKAAAPKDTPSPPPQS